MGQPDTRLQRFKVAVVGQEGWVDQRCNRGIGGGQPHRAPAIGAQHTGVDAIAMAFHFLAPMILKHRGHEMILDIGRGQIG